MMAAVKDMGSLTEPSVPPPAIQVFNLEGNEIDTTAHLVADTEGNEITQDIGVSQPSLSKSTGTKPKMNKLNTNSSGTSNVSKEKDLNKPKSRVVQSRFLSGVSGSKNNSGSKNGLSSSNNSSNSLNCTLGGTLSSSNSTGKNKTTRGSTALKSRVGKSVNNVAKSAGSMGRSTSNMTSNTRPAKSTTSLADTKPTAGGRMRTNAEPLGRSKLHSTVLAERTMLGSTDNIFSTTLIAGVMPGGKKLVRTSKPYDVMSGTFPELPDISAISNSSDKNEDLTILASVSEEDSSQESSTGSFREGTHDDLMREYIRYLQAFYVDVVSEEAFDKQVHDLKTQLTFLDQLTSEKQFEVTECKQKLELLYQHQNGFKAYKNQTEQLNKLVDDLPKSEDALDGLTKELEKNLHQVKMDNLYVPENHKTYRDELSEVLKSQITCLDELKSLMEPRSHQFTSTISLLDDVLINTQHIQQCEREVNQAARLAIQEASLQIVAKQVN